MSAAQLRPELEARARSRGFARARESLKPATAHLPSSEKASRLANPAGDNGEMARSIKLSSRLFLPARAASRARRSAAIDDNPAIQLIWDVISAIPRGQVSTYGAVARAAGFPGRARLAGFALRMAPDDKSLPWHRVVGAGGRIVFLKSSVQHREQSRRLRAEGVAVKDGRVDRSCVADLERA